jgi:polyisoprenyl-phosphate glycosyltransferase
MKTISLIVPCYNEELVINETLKRLCFFCDQQKLYDFELIFVDDGSRDATRSLLVEASMNDDRIKLIGFARNFGHQIAVTAGVDASLGDAVVLIDADLQDPPEIISEMIQKWSDGYDVVYGTRESREGESLFKLLTAKLFYRLLNRLSDISIPLDTGDFRLMDRSVVNAISAMPESDRFIRGMVSWVGFKQIALPYTRSERFAGETKYPLKKMIKFALDGIISFSSKPLQLSIFFGFSISILALLGVAYVFAIRLFTNEWVPGWAGILIATLFLGGVQLISLGILGEYVGRIYSEIKGRPLYVADSYYGFRMNPPKLTRSPVVNLR